MNSFKLNFEILHIVKFTLIFILLTIIGTVSHECGHFFVAKRLGFNPTLHHSNVSFDVEIENSPAFLVKELSILLAGPIQTISTGMIGFVLILIRRRNNDHFKLIDWVATFLSLFWLRQCFNLTMSFVNALITCEFSFYGDEAKISEMLNLHSATIGIITGLLGCIICSFVVFSFVPIRFRYNLIIGGIIGSLLGLYVWTGFLGKFMLP
ncbi:hypothetical protein J2X31_003023 [Flavobacterium arsenatis]|uniref:Peptidase M50 domain-containing protein n=1 Tax=Flavobacterium arsenatis TaxID=1484332 RepID=A0ABU1TT22_9FLAO|nr:hypothetical protein [Flavobacterium arsenatis]MDR6968997.1 hypothetical protein [Flavobacterium arsenatis]